MTNAAPEAKGSPTIKIFVSCRRDMDTYNIDNPLYVPVRSGAVYDKRQNTEMPGDDTGDNISSKNLTFNELTVQYWAWKNIKADYYGLCHYRRFLAFAGADGCEKNELGLYEELFLDGSSAKKYGLIDEANMRKTIAANDLLVMEGNLVTRQCTPRGRCKTIRRLWEAHDGAFFRKSALAKLLEFIRELRPEYYRAATGYMQSNTHYGYNCYIMKRELLEQLCDFEFPVLFALEKWIAEDRGAKHLQRTPGFMGEIMFGIFVYRCLTDGKCRVKQLPLIYFHHAEIIRNPLHRLKLLAGTRGEKFLRSLADTIIPRGTRRREFVKDIYYGVTGKKRV